MASVKGVIRQTGLYHATDRQNAYDYRKRRMDEGVPRSMLRVVQFGTDWFVFIYG